jgi:hypothetical protein
MSLGVKYGSNQSILRFWKDKSWVTVKSLRQGLTREKHLDRLEVFGTNSIDIKEKPTVKLLVDEVCKVSNEFYWTNAHY